MCLNELAQQLQAVAAQQLAYAGLQQQVQAVAAQQLAYAGLQQQVQAVAAQQLAYAGLQQQAQSRTEDMDRKMEQLSGRLGVLEVCTQSSCTPPPSCADLVHSHADTILEQMWTIAESRVSTVSKNAKSCHKDIAYLHFLDIYSWRRTERRGCGHTT